MKVNGRKYTIKTGPLTPSSARQKSPVAYHELKLAIYLRRVYINAIRSGLFPQADFSEAAFLLSEPLPDDLLSADLLCFSFFEGLSESLDLLA
jgi:hypothetical protein